MQNAVYFSAISTKEKIDADKGIIYGVSVITIGEAKGHDVFVDEKSINQILQLAKQKPDGVKVKADHGTGILAVTGKLTNFRKDGEKIRADLELMKSDENYDKFLEMADKMPNEFGLSVSTEAKSEEIDGKKFIRFVELESVDLVNNPAANNGLFSAKTKQPKSMIDKTELCKLLKLDPEAATEQEIQTAFAEFSKKYKHEADGDGDGDDDEPEEKGKKKKMKKKMDGEGDGDGEGKGKHAERFEAGLAKLTELETKISQLESSASEKLALSQKGEIDSLISEAAKLGKVVPFENDDLYTEKDGKVTIKMQPAALAKVISKLSVGQIKTTTTVTLAAKTTDGKPVNRNTQEGREQFRTELSRLKQESQERYLATLKN